MHGESTRRRSNEKRSNNLSVGERRESSLTRPYEFHRAPWTFSLQPSSSSPYPLSSTANPGSALSWRLVWCALLGGSAATHLRGALRKARHLRRLFVARTSGAYELSVDGVLACLMRSASAGASSVGQAVRAAKKGEKGADGGRREGGEKKRSSRDSNSSPLETSSASKPSVLTNYTTEPFHTLRG